jgi:hypothetical protein
MRGVERCASFRLCYSARQIPINTVRKNAGFYIAPSLIMRNANPVSTISSSTKWCCELTTPIHNF